MPDLELISHVLPRVLRGGSVEVRAKRAAWSNLRDLSNSRAALAALSRPVGSKPIHFLPSSDTGGDASSLGVSGGGGS